MVSGDCPEQQMSWCLPGGEPRLVPQHQLYCQVSPAVSLLPVKAEDPFSPPSTENILRSCVTVWYENCSISDHKTLPHIVRTAEKIIRVQLWHSHPHTLHPQSHQHCGRLQTHLTQTLHSFAIWQEIQKQQGPLLPDCVTVSSPKPPDSWTLWDWTDTHQIYFYYFADYIRLALLVYGVQAPWTLDSLPLWCNTAFQECHPFIETLLRDGTWFHPCCWQTHFWPVSDACVVLLPSDCSAAVKNI